MKKGNRFAYSKSKIDVAGRLLSGDLTEHNIDSYIESEEIFDYYREIHLQPLTQITLSLQRSLSSIGISYYIAQRLKRKPQIVRKLNRFSVRLTQLQDIGGCRVILDKNEEVDDIVKYIKDQLLNERGTKIVRETDYRERGRDETGYRAVHLILERVGLKVELQIRSSIQHYWSENIERTSVIYGHLLKESEGDKKVLLYFKFLSDVLYYIERGSIPSFQTKATLEEYRNDAIELIKKSEYGSNLEIVANENVILSLLQKEKSNPSMFHNWIIVFDWRLGQFVTWDIVDRDARSAVDSYVRYEKQYPESDKFEVVLIGSSSIDTVRKTHSHYFGVQRPEEIISSLESEIQELSLSGALNISERKILSVLYRRKHWATKPVAKSTLRNHFCRDVTNFDQAVENLVELGLVLEVRGPLTLNIKRRSEIERYIG